MVEAKKKREEEEKEEKEERKRKNKKKKQEEKTRRKREQTEKIELENTEKENDRKTRRQKKNTLEETFKTQVERKHQTTAQKALQGPFSDRYHDFHFITVIYSSYFFVSTARKQMQLSQNNVSYWLHIF